MVSAGMDVPARLLPRYLWVNSSAANSVICLGHLDFEPHVFCPSTMRQGVLQGTSGGGGALRHQSQGTTTADKSALR